MSHKIFVLLFGLLIINSNIVISQSKPVKFNRLSTSNGLSQNRIFDIAQDHDGFIWIGTEDGLNRYDGYNLEVFKNIPGDTTSLSDNVANRIFIAKNGTLWIGGSLKGLSKYNPNTKDFKNYSNIHHDPNSIIANNISSISEDTKGNIWASTFNAGFDYMIVDEEKFIHMNNMLPKDYEIDFSLIRFIYHDTNNHLWVGTQDKLHYFNVSYTNNRIPKLIPQKIDNQDILTNPTRIEEDKEGNIWVSSFTDGLFIFNKSDKILLPFKLDDDIIDLKKIGILALDSDGDGNIWLGGISNSGITFNNNINDYGLVKIDVKTRTAQKYSNDPKNEKSLSSNVIRKIFSDRSGVLWIGTDLSGVNTYDPSVIKFAIFNADTDDINSINFDAYRSFYLDDNNILWVPTPGTGLLLIDRSKNSYTRLLHDPNDNSSLSSNILSSIYNDDKYIWIGGQGLNRYDRRTKKFKRFYLDPTDIDANRNFINYNIIEIEKYPGFLWFGTSGGGLVSFNKKSGEFKNYTYDPEDVNSLNARANFVRTVWYSPSRPDEIWAGTTNGINILNLKNESFRYYTHDSKDSTTISHPNIMHFYEDDSGFVWVSTYGGGFNRFDPKTEKFKRFTESNSGLPNNGVYGILPDDDGNFWMSTNNGIAKFNPETFAFRNYTVDDGLQSEEFNGGSYYKSKSGEMFFGGINGFNSFFPSEVVDNEVIPEIVFTDLKIFNESVNVGVDSPLKEQISKAEEITLSHWQNDISFEFVALHFANPSKNKYAFKLENYEDEWRYVDNIRVATYTNLDPGKYVFHVKGSNNDGLWNEEGKSIKVIITSPWWSTTWAYISYFLILVGSIVGLDRFQRARIRTREKQKAQLALLEAENNRKSAELEEARTLQLSMLPRNLPSLPNFDIAVYMKTATEVGGDYYDFHVGLDGTLTVVIGDATGHGMKAGTMVTTTKSLFNVLAPNPDLLLTFNEMTRCIKTMELKNLTMCMTLLKLQENKMRISSAGMPPSYIFRSDSGNIDEFLIKGMPLGAFTDFPYETRETEINKGDSILLMSDGFPELFNDKKEMFGYGKVKDVFEEVKDGEPEEIIEHLKNAGSEWTNDEVPEDDVTFVVIKVK